MSARLRVTILGCGSSGGVPRVGGEWGACDPSDPRNRRLRCSLLVERYKGTYDHDQATVVLIDTSPDLREQLLNAKVRHIDGLLFTHDHADQCHGIDDLRAIVYHQRRLIPTWMDNPTTQGLTNRFGYIFQTPAGSSYPPLLEAKHMPQPGQSVVVDGPGGAVRLQVLAQNHGDIDSLGFRIGPVVYCNDCKDLPTTTLAMAKGADLFIVDALRYTSHPSHANVDQALDWIQTIQPRHAVLTNMHVDLDYATLAAQLPSNVEPAVDFWMWDTALEVAD